MIENRELLICINDWYSTDIMYGYVVCENVIMCLQQMMIIVVHEFKISLQQNMLFRRRSSNR